jgi:hypothetical protein
MVETAESKLRADGGGKRWDETASLDGRMKGKPARYAFAGAGRIIHHILWQHLLRGERSNVVINLIIGPVGFTHSYGCFQSVDWLHPSASPAIEGS